MALRQVILMGCFALILAFTGCGSEPDGKHGSPGSEASAGTNSSGTPVDFQEEPVEQLPEDVKKHFDRLTSTPQGGHATIPHGSRIFLIVSAGQRPTGGYQVKITDILRKGETVHIYAEEIAPAKDSMVTQAITYPAAVVSISQKDEANYEFHLKKASPPSNDQ
ncbi:protease complex subunit PrcB family protein [Planifilum fimeticola]|jgi:hypothetical protein